MQKKIYSKIVFNAYKRHYTDIKTFEQLNEAKKAYYAFFDDFGAYQGTIKKFLEYKEYEFKKDSLSRLIKPFEPVEPLSFNLKGLDSVKTKINKIDSPKLKFEFEGLFNLLNDSKNLIYNSLSERTKIIKDLNKFKSLKYFKVGYVSRYNLKNQYKHLSFKNDCTKNHTKVYFIKSGLYVLKTLKHDDLNLKVFYVGNRYKTLLNKSTNKVFCPLKGDKYNLSSTEAYKVLDKKDNMKYYSYCNSIGLDKSNRQLLRSIRKSKRLSKDSLIDYLEDRRNDILEDIEISSNLEVLYLEIELQEVEAKLQELKTFEEDNSMEDKTYLSDYF